MLNLLPKDAPLLHEETQTFNDFHRGSMSAAAGGLHRFFAPSIFPNGYCIFKLTFSGSSGQLISVIYFSRESMLDVLTDCTQD